MISLVAVTEDNRRSKRSLGMSDVLKKLLYVLCFSLVVLPSWAFTSLTHSCPESFTGTVVSVSELQTPLLNRNKIEVVFQVDEVIKGDVPTEVTLQFIPISHLKITAGNSYTVSTENGFLCGLVK